MTKRHFGLRVDHPTESAESISEAFGVLPDVTQSVGMPRVTPKGQRLDGVYRATYLFFDLGTAPSVSDGLAKVLAFAAQHRAVLDHVIDTGGTCEVLVHQDFSEANGVDLDAAEISALAKFSLGFGFDLLGSTTGD